MRVFNMGVVGCLLLMMAASCRDKNKDVRITPNGTELQLVADSVYLFSREIYFWDEIRTRTTYTSFNPRQYVKSTDVETAEATIAAVRSFNSYDSAKEYSYATDYYNAETGSMATQPENSYGFFVKSGKNRVTGSFTGWFVTYVYPDSYAGRNEVQRGWKIVKVDETTLGNNTPSVAVLNNMFYYETTKSARVTFEKPTGEQVPLDLSIASFIPSSVLYSNILQSPRGAKAGYLVYKFFDQLEDSRPAIEAALRSFNDAGVKNIILDLRYNNGGFTRTQDFLANSLAPATAGNGNKMYTYYYNADLQAGNYPLMRTRHAYSASYYKPDAYGNTVTFNKTDATKGFPINPGNLFVIVSKQTASSAELLINDLKPYFNGNIKLIGDDNTFGKPVGFFPVDLFKKVTFWTVSFMTKNSTDTQVPYAGFTPDYKVYDGVDKAWGDVTEDCTKVALDLIDGIPVKVAVTTGTTARAATQVPEIQLKKQYYDNMLR
ncbi:S41 family peptidase [Niabella sp.]|uniref:S41 family peptidase n=1 Tax=Niabella sp. TaxID=1962976 RepID=UPI0026216751|nr:S41 family peptidase [Niabella sp.]